MNIQPEGTYDFSYSTANVYGHVVNLLTRQANAGVAGVHLDIGCGYGRTAEPLCAALPRTYVGCDQDLVSLASLTERGFETHELWLTDEAQTYAALRKILAGRVVASIAALDIIEHLVDPFGVLRAIRRIAAEDHAVVVFSVPNITHRDIGIKLATGRFDYTATGLLDRTHRLFFSEAGLRSALSSAGLTIVDMDDVRLPRTEQAFPETHSAFMPGTSLQRFMTTLRDLPDDTAETYQFVRACVPDSAVGVPGLVVPEKSPDLFLSVVIRTQGRRSHTLRELLACLAAQTCDDFEIVLVGHELTEATRPGVEALLADLPDWLQRATRLILVEGGGRVTPLNKGLSEAKGRYAAFIDDDDLPFAHWVETFADLENQHAGKVFRAVTVVQDVEAATVLGETVVRATGGFERRYPSQFSFVDHLSGNLSPICSLAFPRGCVHDLGMRFDDALTTAEDWDFLMRTVSLVGIASSPAVTTIYRWWGKEPSSRTEHAHSEWARNADRIHDKLAVAPMILPSGSVWEIRTLSAEAHHLRGLSRARGEEIVRLIEAESATRAELERQISAQAVWTALLGDIEAIRSSTSWKLTAPVRAVRRLASRAGSVANLHALDAEALGRLADDHRRSTSWRMTAPLRALSRRGATAPSTGSLTASTRTSGDGSRDR